MKQVSRNAASFRVPELHAALFVLAVLLCAFPGCGKSEDAPTGRQKSPEGVRENVVDGWSSGYMDMKGWELAKTEMKTSEEVVGAFNRYFQIWSWAYEHRTFLRFREALETAAYLPAQLEKIEKLVKSIRRVPGYPEIDELKECYVKMIPLLRSGGDHLRQSIEAARDNNEAAEKVHEWVYVARYKEAMAYSRKSFAIMPEILTRGSRTEYQKYAGAKQHVASTAVTFNAAVRRVMADYDGPIMKEIAGIPALAAQEKWDLASMKADEADTRLQHAIMEAGRAEPGNLKVLWDARQELVGMLSYRMMGNKKFKEYMEKTRAGDVVEAGKAKKVYRILVKSAEDSRVKLRKMGF